MFEKIEELNSSLEKMSIILKNTFELSFNEKDISYIVIRLHEEIYTCTSNIVISSTSPLVRRILSEKELNLCPNSEKMISYLLEKIYESGAMGKYVSLNCPECSLSVIVAKNKTTLIEAIGKYNKNNNHNPYCINCFDNNEDAEIEHNIYDMDSNIYYKKNSR